jgi:hypothetical protein
MKNYQTPRLVAQGEVVERTQGSIGGYDDPVAGQKLVPLGSKGFNL